MLRLKSSVSRGDANGESELSNNCEDKISESEIREYEVKVEKTFVKCGQRTILLR